MTSKAKHSKKAPVEEEIVSIGEDVPDVPDAREPVAEDGDASLDYDAATPEFRHVGYGGEDYDDDGDEDVELPTLAEIVADGVVSSEGVGLADIAANVADSLARIAEGVDRHNKLLFKLTKVLDAFAAAK